MDYRRTVCWPISWSTHTHAHTHICKITFISLQLHDSELFLPRRHHMELEDPFIASKTRESARCITTHRVNGELSVSRAIGDPDYKGETP